MVNEYEIKKQICEIGKRIYDRGMVASNDGNISVKLNDNIKTIGRKAFMNCTALTDLILPDSVETVQDDAFNSCYNLSVKSFNGSYIGRRAFAGCNVNNIQLSENLSYIGLKNTNGFPFSLFRAEDFRVRTAPLWQGLPWL